jgi:hypothetical protein
VGERSPVPGGVVVTNSKVGGRPTQNLVGLFGRNYFSQKIFEKNIF